MCICICVCMCVYIYIYIYCCHTREFRDVVFEDVVFDNNSSVTPYKAKSSYRIR